MKLYRFFFHYRKQTKRMSVHYRGKCHDVGDVICHRGCESKWNKTQPQLVMQGWASEVTIVDDKAHIL